MSSFVSNQKLDFLFRDTIVFFVVADDVKEVVTRRYFVYGFNAIPFYDSFFFYYISLDFSIDFILDSFQLRICNSDSFTRSLVGSKRFFHLTMLT